MDSNKIQEITDFDEKSKYPNLLFIKHSQNQTTLEIDCLQRLNIQISQDQLVDCCSICNDTWQTIFIDQKSEGLLTNCNHIICKKDFDYNALQQHYPLCKQELLSGMVLKIKEQDNLNKCLIMQVVGYERYKIDFFRNIKCSKQEYPNRANSLCNICQKISTALCSGCLSHSAEASEFALRKYLSSLFYCGCNIQVSLVRIWLGAPQPIDLAYFKYLTLPEKYNAASAEENTKNQLFFCPICKFKSFNDKWQVDSHIRDSHQKVSAIYCPAQKQCPFCNITYANQVTYENHKCKAQYYSFEYQN